MPPQGITSFTVDPNSHVAIGQAWVDDLLALGTQATGPLLLRANVRADDHNNLPIDLYQRAFALYHAPNHMDTYALLTEEFDHFGDQIGAITDPLTEPLNNPYIDDFSFRAADFAIRLRGSGLQRFFIWNEPNDNVPGNLDSIPDPAHFAALLFQCFTRIKAHVPGAAVYMGGLLWPNGAPSNGGVVTPAQATQEVVSYLMGVHRHLQQHGAGIPWDAVNVHVHHAAFTDQDMANLRTAIDGIFPNHADRRPVFVGEWGVTCDEARAPGTTQHAFTCLRDHFDAMWYFQHPTRDNPFDCADGDFGATQWNIAANGTFVPGPHCTTFDELKACYQAPARFASVAPPGARTLSGRRDTRGRSRMDRPPANGRSGATSQSGEKISGDSSNAT